MPEPLTTRVSRTVHAFAAGGGGQATHLKLGKSEQAEFDAITEDMERHGGMRTDFSGKYSGKTFMGLHVVESSKDSELTVSRDDNSVEVR